MTPPSGGRPAGPARRAAPSAAALLPALAAVVALLVAACAGPAPSPAPSGATPGGSAAPTGGAPSPGPSGSADPLPGVVLDRGLLAILPVEVAGVPVGAEDEAFAEAARDPDFARSVARAAYFIAVAPDDLAAGPVAELRPGVFSEGFYRAWRDSYDEGACGQAGGVAGTAATTIGGWATWVTTCSGGLRVYHVWIEERGVLISAISLGEARLGERIVAGLRP